MPRTAQSIEAGMVYHVLNRGNCRLRLFHKERNYDAFERVLVEGLKRYPVDLLTYCLMPNHWHLVVRPRTDVALGRLDGLGGSDARPPASRALSPPWHRTLVPGAIQSFPVADDDYFLTLCRYVEANPMRAKLVERAEQWRWCELWRRAHRSNDLVLSP
ncbi:MAG TPA: transposase [Terriglobia bacterium]|nr:transposase [Terriglobia bacterium]